MCRWCQKIDQFQAPVTGQRLADAGELGVNAVLEFAVCHCAKYRGSGESCQLIA
jgi:hypothetical protein